MNRPAELKKARIRHSTEWTGLRADTTSTPEATVTAAKTLKMIAAKIISALGEPCRRGSSGGRVERELLRDFALPAVAVREKLLLVVEQLLAGLGGELQIRPLDDRIDRAGLLAIAAVDAFRHIDVIARRAAAAVLARLRLDRDRQRRADRLAQFAGDAALLAVRIAAQYVLAAKTRADRVLLVRIIDRHRRLEHVAQRQRHALQQLDQQQAARPARQGNH